MLELCKCSHEFFFLYEAVTVVCHMNTPKASLVVIVLYTSYFKLVRHGVNWCSIHMTEKWYGVEENW